MNHTKLTFRFLTAILIFSFALLGCEPDDDHHDEGQDDHVCEHLLDGPVATLTATADIATAADLLANDANYRVQALQHTRYDVTFLIDSLGSYGGYIPYLPVAGDGDYVLYLNESATIELLNMSDGNVLVSAENVEDHSDDCDLVAYRAIYHLHDTDEYVIHIRDASSEVVGMLFPDLEEDDHDH